MHLRTAKALYTLVEKENSAYMTEKSPRIAIHFPPKLLGFIASNKHCDGQTNLAFYKACDTHLTLHNALVWRI